MKKINKLMLGIALVLAGLAAKAQNGLESIIVEKYYVSNAADSVGASGFGSDLRVGSVTYRVYVDMLPGYKFQAAYGVAGHPVTISTTTQFYTNIDRGDVYPLYSKTNARLNSVMLDSWLSVGAACASNFGVLKSEDAIAGGANVVNASGILANSDASAGIPLTTSDGLYAGTPEAVTTVGFSAAELDFLSNSGTVGSILTSSNASWASLNGSTGPLASNRVLIGQFTTNGVFHYELNIQIGTPTGGTQNYVAVNPTGAEISIPSLSGTLGAPNALPTVSITSPATGAGFLTGSTVAIAATAADADGTVSSVEFFVDGVSIGVDNSSPYSANYTAVAGTHSLTARATDNNGGQTTSGAVTINVASNPPPTVSITAPSNGSSFITGSAISITANAADNSAVASVEFFVDGVSVGLDNSSPYSSNYTVVVGVHSLTARATDDQGAQATSAAVSITVANNPAPTVNITSPSNGSSFVVGTTVTINANAADNGSVASVEFFVDGVSVGLDNSSPYSASYVGVLGTHSVTARATDNLGAQTTSSAININIVSTILPYRVATISDICSASLFCLPVLAVNPVSNVIGYDAVMLYNKSKVRPTGVVTVSNSLINPSYVDVANSIDTANGSISISLYFNGAAPVNARFTGSGSVFCVEFVKTANFGSTDTATFSLPFIQESYFTGVISQLADIGKYNAYQDNRFKSDLHFWLDNSPIRYDISNPSTYLITNIYGTNISCGAQSAISVQPDLGGSFDYSILNGSNISIQRDIAGTTSVQPVVNGFDAFLTRKVLVNDPSFTPSVYQMIGMDVNLDGVVSAGDLSQINQRAVLLISEFKQAWNYSAIGISNGQLSKDWLFVDQTRVTTDLSYRISSSYPSDNGVGYSKSRVPVVPFCLPVPVSTTAGCQIVSQEQYKGVLLGDVNGNFATIGSGGVLRTSQSEKVVFDLTKAIVANGYADVPVSLVSDENVNSLDFAMTLNNGNLTFKEILDNTNYLNTLENVSADDNTLRFTSYSLQNYETAKSIVYVRFAMYTETLNETDFASLESFVNGEKVNTEIRSTRLAANKGENFVSVYPNPTNGILNILVAEDARLQLIDLEGRVVFFEANVKADEKQEVNTANLTSGIYIIKIFNSNFVSMKKVVVKK